LKPPGMTSHDVISFLRRTLKIRKAGHTGTLDPGVAGVLAVCLGKATKAIEYMEDGIKHYRAEVSFGRTTDTQDSFGHTVKVYDASLITEGQAKNAILSWRGKHLQMPPMVSAVKHKGKKLYELAREGKEVPRCPRPVEIYEINIIRFRGFGTPNPSVLFDLTCSRGTYVRTLCHDTGEVLGCGGYMSFLVRTGTGNLDISDSLMLEEILEKTENGNIRDCIIPVHRAIPFAEIWVKDKSVNSVCHGNRIPVSETEGKPDSLEKNQKVKLMNRGSGCLAIARVVHNSPSDCLSIENNSTIMFQPIKVLC